MTSDKCYLFCLSVSLYIRYKENINMINDKINTKNIVGSSEAKITSLLLFRIISSLPNRKILKVARKLFEK